MFWERKTKGEDRTLLLKTHLERWLFLMHDKRIREKRLVTYEEEIVELNKHMKELLKGSEADSVLLIDKDGHMVSVHGQTETLRQDNLAALVAGSFASMKAIANELGEPSFNSFFQQGDQQNLYVVLVGGRSLLTVIFSESAKLGMVKLFSETIKPKMEKVMKEYDQRVINHEIHSPTSTEIGSKLDALFGI
jgi:predicted regulator of Ras-like GTPase activity (Roadblock/LC7/MglB family)